VDHAINGREDMETGDYVIAAVDVATAVVPGGAGAKAGAKAGTKVGGKVVTEMLGAAKNVVGKALKKGGTKKAVGAGSKSAAAGGGGAKFRLRPTQDKVSGPQVDRLAADMKKNGFNPSYPVKVDGDLVVNGHHRVMAARKAGVEVATTPSVASSSAKANALDSFDGVKIDPVDWYD
jgi:hypothetical protein